MKITKEILQETQQRIKPFVHRTPIMSSQLINEIAGVEIYFKCENFQKMGAFKMRGATNAILQLSETEREFGVATHSSGNFAQALALAAKLQGIKAYVVMPSNAPEIKKTAVKGYGGDVIECIPTLEARETTLNDIVNKTGAIFLHPYNDYQVIEGQGTAAMELIEEHDDLDAIFTPVGGGGLLAGTAMAAHHFSPKTKVIAGEPMGADDAWQSLQKGEIVPQTNPQTIADGLLTSLGDKTFPIIKEHVEEIIRVEEKEIIAAMRLIWERMKLIVEPSSAVALAALLKEKKKYKGQKIGIILSGGNVELSKLPF
ncbi:pyridoxal-phosphate dependent enzyme [Labilibaculum sp. DW002]|uniref:Pyridoxal-phosphate dependent enzyme n=1 Tax=Paralabilibaculum antarcticum TaxID=2912572 RepID=A0ABT5VMC4_9BACT|nr:pyridoxal-phosphate dependent enzyme [Labilibaculum sp. DW002]MDE5416590.1 pyridoxal-phosphate dependent enzyme [Labilibaculum sp. DW002]|eukprot:TRINITY_DN75365_c0_g3_i1.p1 TRINITY_DN75365_c0_g3~~TRINITY_DN75365_c0_g3_i1.p1  ORF type:complete len:314 (+),score=67.76 TRINITY_DN75365_c0_g3_i1:69-1010(+)